MHGRATVADTRSEVAPIAPVHLRHALYAMLLLLDRLSRGRGEVSEGLVGTSVPEGSFGFDVWRRIKDTAVTGLLSQALCPHVGNLRERICSL